LIDPDRYGFIEDVINMIEESILEMDKDRVLQLFEFLKKEFEIVFTSKKEKLKLLKLLDRINWVESLELGLNDADRLGIEIG